MAGILVVEDDEDIRELLGGLLADHGYAVTLAADGREALACLGDRPLPDVLLLDLMMPGMNGWQLLERLAAQPALARIPVVVMTAATTVKPPGCRELLLKPLDPNRLLELLERYLP